MDFAILESASAKSAAGGAPISLKGATPMNDVLEVLSALANIASIARFLLDLRRFLKAKEKDKQQMDDVV